MKNQKYALKRRPRGYWTEETIMSELQPIINQLGYFPSQSELKKMKRNDLIYAMKNHGSINHFNKLFGYKPKNKPIGYWTDENTISELELVIEELNGRFPSYTELIEMKRCDLVGATQGNINYFREKMGYEILRRPNGYWTEENIISELELIIKTFGDFPTHVEMYELGESKLLNVIFRNGGINYFREKMGYKPLKKKHNTKMCDIIKKHHNDLKDDPQRLSTEFLQKMLGTDCDVKKTGSI